MMTQVVGRTAIVAHYFVRLQLALVPNISLPLGSNLQEPKLYMRHDGESAGSYGQQGIPVVRTAKMVEIDPTPYEKPTRRN